MDRQQRRQFVREHRTCVFGYARQQHGPAMTIVYYVMDGDDILISTMAERAKAKAVERSPQVSLCVLDERWPPTYLQVYGTAAVQRDEEQAADLLRRVVELMAGQPVPDERREQIAKMARDEQRVVVPGDAVCDLRDSAAARQRDGRSGRPQPRDEREHGLVGPGPRCGRRLLSG